MIQPSIRAAARRHHDAFRSALPFPHLILDDFFEADTARRLLEDFPPFDSDNARDEFGGVGRKAVVTDIGRISPVYADVARHLASRDFLDVISELTGIADLVHDARMFGGGTHENREGQALDPHVDFNYLEDRGLHRRLNLLVYLNAEWETEWGGCLELHSNPRRPRENQIKLVAPLFNRAVLFETSERSWHGFERIQLPEEKSHVSRKALSIYLYTRERPADQVVPPHGTFYVQRPAPPRFREGYTLTESDAKLIEILCMQRDSWIEYYQNKEMADSGRIQELTARLGEVESSSGPSQWLSRAAKPKPSLASTRAGTGEAGTLPVSVPWSGYATQEGSAVGYWEDRWMGSPFQVGLRLHRAIAGLEVLGYLPEGTGPERELHLVASGGDGIRYTIGPGRFTIHLPCAVDAGMPLDLRIESDRTHCPVREGTGPDVRELVALLVEIRLLHVAPA